MGGTPPEEKEESPPAAVAQVFADAVAEVEMNPQFPLEISGIKLREFFPRAGWLTKPGTYVAIRPCGDEYEGKTYLGIAVGDVAIGAHASLNKKSNEIEVFPHMNPAIFVPELGKLIFGCESWWGPIRSPEQLKEITDDDIQNVWYVKALKQLQEAEKEEEDA